MSFVYDHNFVTNPWNTLKNNFKLFLYFLYSSNLVYSKNFNYKTNLFSSYLDTKNDYFYYQIPNLFKQNFSSSTKKKKTLLQKTLFRF